MRSSFADTAPCGLGFTHFVASAAMAVRHAFLPAVEAVESRSDERTARSESFSTFTCRSETPAELSSISPSSFRQRVTSAVVSR